MDSRNPKPVIALTRKNLIPTRDIMHLNLPGLVETGTYKYKGSNDVLVVSCQPDSRKRQQCPECRRKVDLTVHSYLPGDRVVHDVNVGTTQIFLSVRTPRWRCPEGHVFTHVFDDIMESRQMTRRLYETIKREAFSKTFADVAADYNLSEPTVAKIFDEYCEELEAERGEIVAPRVLGIDEKHIVNAARGVFVDIETGELLEMTTGNSEKDIIGAIQSMLLYDDLIKIVTIDMYRGYKKYVQTCLPYARIVVDKYHVFQALGKRVNKVRSTLQDVFSAELVHDPDQQKKRLLATAGRDSYLFKFNSDHLAEDPRRIRLMADLCITFPEFNHLRIIKEVFETIYKADTREEAERRYLEWKKLIPPKAYRPGLEWQKEYGVRPGLFEPLIPFVGTIDEWYDEIFNYFDPDARVTNAATEGNNQDIERLNRMGNGLSFERLRAKAIFKDYATRKTRYKLIEKKLPDYDGKLSFPIHYAGINPQSRTSLSRDTPTKNVSREFYVEEDIPSDECEG